MIYNNDTSLETKEEISTGSKVNKDLVLFNDDYHTFDFVIDALINVCDHSAEQAEQSAYIVHFNGKCTVKNGSEKKLRPLKDALIDRDLRAKLI
jgi:ATP-dependent Clp protease adaptor protein ClpS